MRCPLLIVLLLVGIDAPAQAQVARQEVHAFQSVTLSDTEFLNAKQDGQPVTLSGLLRLPKVGPEKLPAVVLLHGAGGMGGTGSMIDEWSLELNQIGIATFAVDSWSGRGIVETATDQTRAGRLNRIATPIAHSRFSPSTDKSIPRGSRSWASHMADSRRYIPA